MKRSLTYHIKQAEKHTLIACKLADLKVEKMARTILRNHPQYDEFVMCMGTYFFTLKDKTGYNTHVDPLTELRNSSHNYYHTDTYKYFKPLNDFIFKYNNDLKITGSAMRFTATGKKITDW